jgi:hypothetical protein
VSSAIRRPVCALILLVPLAACGGRGAEGPEILSAIPTMCVSCKVANQDIRARIAEGPLGYPYAGATQRVEVFAIDEADARRQFQTASIGTRERPCLHVARERI